MRMFVGLAEAAETVLNWTGQTECQAVFLEYEGSVSLITSPPPPGKDGNWGPPR